jgi:hypothetical protein
MPRTYAGIRVYGCAAELKWMLAVTQAADSMVVTLGLQMEVLPRVAPGFLVRVLGMCQGLVQCDVAPLEALRAKQGM